METNASQHTFPAPQDDRRRFLRRSLCDAQIEFSHLESPLKIIEGALLTAMGTLGTACGFSSVCQPEADGITVLNRGMDGAVIQSIEDNFQHLVDRYFSTLETSPSPSPVDIRMLAEAPDPPGLLTTAKIRILVGWRMGNRDSGLMGLGPSIKAVLFSDSEVDFLYNLVDHMMVAIRAIAANAVIHTLENELDQARQSTAETIVRNEAAKKELEETRFRLSGFNDIFHELSGIKESEKVLDAFLLVMLGIFSAQNGYILYGDDNTRKAHTVMRGFENQSIPHWQPAEVRKKLGVVFAFAQGSSLGVMQATILPQEQLVALDLFSSKSRTAILFNVDQAARGVLCLGKRLVETQYGSKEKELLLAFTHTFLAFLKNSKSFETIERLHADQRQKTIALEKTVQALSESRRTIAGLEKAGERIKATIAGIMARSTRVSVIDVALILIAGTILGMVYNFASPTGIPIVPRVWRHPPSPRISIDRTKALLDAQTIILVDARPVEFFKQRHIRGALNLPLALFDFVYMMRFSQLDPHTPIVVYGRNISRHYDEEIAYKLTQRGHPSVSILTGGVDAWQAKGLTR